MCGLRGVSRALWDTDSGLSKSASSKVVAVGRKWGELLEDAGHVGAGRDAACNENRLIKRVNDLSFESLHGLAHSP